MAVVVLFGGSGRVGSATLEALLSKPGAGTAPPPEHLQRESLALRVITRHPAKVDFGPQVQVFAGDVDDPKTVRRALRGATRVFLLTAAHPEQLHREASIISAASDSGVEGIVKISGSNGLVDARSRSLGMRHHAASEEHLRKSGLRWAILRPSAFIQTLMEQIAPHIRDRGRFALPGKNKRYCFVDVRDVGAVAAALLSGEEHWNETHILTGPEPLGYAEVAQLLSSILRKPVAYRPQSLFLARLAINQRIHNHYARFEAADLLIALAAASGDAPSDTIERILGRPPRTLGAWIQENLEQFQ